MTTSAAANASLLLYQPCTVGTARCLLHHTSASFLQRRKQWRMPGMVLRQQHQQQQQHFCKERVVTCSSAVPVPGAEATEEASVEQMLTELEQGASPAAAAAAEAKPRQQRPPPLARSRTFTVKDEELVAGKVLKGRVKSILSFGAFIDLGARLDGLLHISKLSEGFISSVEQVLQVGQEVEVQIIDADIPNRRIKLKLTTPIPRPDSPARTPSGAGQASSGGGREAFRGKIAGRGASQTRRTPKAKSKYRKGEEVTGVVKNLTKRGCFVQLPGEEEGFLSASEISEGRANSPIESLVKTGQEVKVKVLRITDGRLILSMKEEIDLDKINAEINENIVATNPFELAFRKSALLRKYLEEKDELKDKENQEVKASEQVKDGDLADENEKLDKTAEAQEATQAEDTLQQEEVVPEPVQDVEEDGAQAGLKQAEVVPLDAQEEAPLAQAELVPLEEVEETPPEAADAALQEAEQTDSTDEEPQAVTEESQALPEEPQALPEEPQALPEEPQAVPEEPQAVPEEPQAVPEEPAAVVQAQAESSAPEAPKVSAALVKQLRELSGAGMMECKRALVETDCDLEKAVEFLRKKGLAGAEKKAGRIAAEGAIGSYVHDNRIGVLLEVNSETDFVSRGDIFTQLVEDLAMQVAASQQVEYVSVEDIPAEFRSKETDIEMQREDIQSKPEAIRSKIVEGRVNKRLGDLALLEQPFIKNDSILVKDLIKQTIATVGEKIQVRRFSRYVLGEGLEKRSHDLAAEVEALQAAKVEDKEEPAKAEAAVAKDAEAAVAEDAEAAVAEDAEGADASSVSAALVKELREATGAGMMDCKKALVEAQCDFEKAKEYLRKKGLASAEKKAGRIAAEGAIVSYVHAGRIGVLLEVNCETDFVARNSVFRELAEELAMQVVACPQVEFIAVEDVPAEVRDKEREIEMQREDLASKPEQIRGRIVEGRLAKLLGERCLLEQPFLKDDSLLVKDVLKRAAASLGENVRVRRYVRYTLGEGIQKRSGSFAEEVAAQLAGAAR